MGLIRKTLSLSTLGLVNWHSKKERLAQTESELAVTRAKLDKTDAALSVVGRERATLLERLADAESKTTQAELVGLRNTRRARRRGRIEQRRRGNRSLWSTARSLASPIVDTAIDAGTRVAADVEPVVDEATTRGRSARKVARREMKQFRSFAAKEADWARDRAEALADSTSKKVRKAKKKAAARADDVADSARHLADDARSRLR